MLKNHKFFNLLASDCFTMPLKCKKIRYWLELHPEPPWVITLPQTPLSVPLQTSQFPSKSGEYFFLFFPFLTKVIIFRQRDGLDVEAYALRTGKTTGGFMGFLCRVGQTREGPGVLCITAALRYSVIFSPSK